MHRMTEYLKKFEEKKRGTIGTIVRSPCFTLLMIAFQCDSYNEV